MKMKNYFYVFSAILLLAQNTRAQEKLLYSTDFQNWSTLSSTNLTTVTQTTDFSAEPLTFNLFGTYVVPTGVNTSKFNYNVVSIGYLQTQKTYEAYIELSALKSITKVEFIEGATGNNRGFKLWKKSKTDSDWVLKYSTACVTASGQVISVDINETDIALKFTSVDIANNSYLFGLKIYGNYTSSVTQVALNTSVNTDAAGTITRTPNSDTYDQGSIVSLTATQNFGYKFVKWVDASNNELSTANPYTVTLNAETNIKAVFEAVNTYSYDVTIAGSKWGEVKLTPSPTNGKYEEGTQVTMEIISNPVTTFSYWEDNSTDTKKIISVDGNKSFTATFDEIPFIVGWNFRDQTVKTDRQGDYYSETTNTGLISTYEPDGTSVNWLINTGAFSPSYPCIRFWTSGSEFQTKRRYLQSKFSTVGYKNIQIKSMVSANYQAYSIMTLQYSINGTDFTTLGSVDITSVYNSGWKELNATLPAEAEGIDMVYIRWVADATSTILGESTTNNDGTAFTNIYAFADKVITEDHDAPLLVSAVPVDGSGTASINGSVVLTFNEKVMAGTGNITLNSTALTASFGSKTATFRYERLSYNTEYTFTVPAGALTDLSGNPFAGNTITFRTGVRSEPTKKLFDAVVAPDGSGDYTTILDAIAGAPSNRAIPWLIYIENGTYTGHHDIPATKPFIHLIGQSRDGVIVSDNRLCGTSGTETVYSVALGATMVVNSADCYFENITFQNSWGYEKQAGPQALALYTLNDHITLKNCYLRSYQDTYLSTYSNVSYRHYLQNCKIEGAVDFIYGGGDVFFDNCLLNCMRQSGGYIVAPSHQTGTAWGYVFSNCTIDGPAGVTTYFGRPWQNSPKTVFLNTTIKASVYPVGWYYKMGTIPSIFADYGTMDKDGNAVDVSQRISDYEYDIKDANGTVTETVKGKAQKSLTDAEAATYTYENVILRAGDAWDPRMIAEAPEKPSNVTVSSSTISWNGVPYTRLYIVFRNSIVLGFTTDTQFTDTKATVGQSYTYAVQAVSEYGALSEITEATSGTTGIKIPKRDTDKIFVYSLQKVAYVSGVEKSYLISVYNLSGRLMDSRVATSTNESFTLKPGLYLIKISSNKSQKNLKVVVE
jgi:pectin methylesterase-like acyl-CoA thioesterase/methionine-rich copper-binding protein CopC